MNTSFTNPSLALVLVATALSACSAFAAQPIDRVLAAYQLEDRAACKKPAAAAPAPVKESDVEYNLQRHEVDLDGDGRCEIMDFWIKSLSGNSSPGMRAIQHRLWRYTGGKWQEFSAELPYVPYVIKHRTTGERILVAAPNRYDMDDRMIFGRARPVAFSVRGWGEQVKGDLPVLLLEPAASGAGPAIQALAVHLALRMRQADQSNEADRARIAALLRQAKVLLPPGEVVPVTAAGDMPMLPGSGNRVIEIHR